MHVGLAHSSRYSRLMSSMIQCLQSCNLKTCNYVQGSRMSLPFGKSSYSIDQTKPLRSMARGTTLLALRMQSLDHHNLVLVGSVAGLHLLQLRLSSNAGVYFI